MPARIKKLQGQADVLYRAAAECHRQHTRYSKLVQKEAPDWEQAAALEVAFMCDDFLATAMTGYEQAKDHGEELGDQDWWHKANMLWHSCREYIRRHANCEGISRRRATQTQTRLGELTLSFDLEASALLALKMAADSYRGVRPEAD
jgi:hypothetical protein